MVLLPAPPSMVCCRLRRRCSRCRRRRQCCCCRTAKNGVVAAAGAEMSLLPLPTIDVVVAVGGFYEIVAGSAEDGFVAAADRAAVGRGVVFGGEELCIPVAPVARAACSRQC